MTPITDLRRLHAESTQVAGKQWHPVGPFIRNEHDHDIAEIESFVPWHPGEGFRSDKAVNAIIAFIVAAHNSMPELLDKIDDTANENDKLRALLAASGADCAYCGLPAAEMAKCADGFPGCARADDLMCGPSAPTRGELLDRLERYERALREARRLHQEWEKATGQIDSAAYRVLCDALEGK